VSNEERQRTVKGGGGSEPEEKLAEDAKQSAQAASTEAAAEETEKPKAKRRRAKKAEPEAEGTAAAETGVDKEGAEAAKKTEEADVSEAQEDKPAPSRRRRGPQKATKEQVPAHPARDGAALVRARARYVRTSARKARLIADHVRGKSVEDARAILAFSPRAVARDWTKVLESAVANAEHNHELVGDELRIAAITADEGPTLKRYRPRAMGRATRIRKRTSHLTITLTPKE
jgi:large subunit ribosomal protein L22